MVGSRLLRQRRGIAIGGIISAQMAELYCMAQEVSFLRQPSVERIKVQRAFICSGTLPLDPYSFRDNVVEVISGRTTLGKVKVWFEHLYLVEL